MNFKADLGLLVPVNNRTSVGVNAIQAGVGIVSATKVDSPDMKFSFKFWINVSLIGVLLCQQLRPLPKNRVAVLATKINANSSLFFILPFCFGLIPNLPLANRKRVALVD